MNLFFVGSQLAGAFRARASALTYTRLKFDVVRLAPSRHGDKRRPYKTWLPRN